MSDPTRPTDPASSAESARPNDAEPASGAEPAPDAFEAGEQLDAAAGDPVDDLARLAADAAHESRAYLTCVSQVATGASPEITIPLLLLATSQVLAAGARLGAVTDFVPEERFESDPGPDIDLDPVRQGLVDLLTGLDDYGHVVDPLVNVQITSGSLSNDLTEVAAALTHGLQHYEAGRISEALWWWQFSFMSSWGDSAARAMRVLLAVLGHIRLDADEDLVAEAEFDALHP